MEIVGIYYKTLFRNAKTGYTLFIFKHKIKQEDYYDYKYTVCRYVMPIYAKGMPLKLKGNIEIETNSQNEKKEVFICTSIEEFIDDREIAIAYLSSGFCPGIRKANATKIVDTFGPNIFDLAKKENATEIIKEKIKRLSIETIEQLIRNINENVEQRKLFEYISKFGGNYTSALNIVAEFGIYSLKELKFNPYYVGQIGNLPFGVCDMIAKECNFHEFDKKRIEALVYQAMIEISESGHTYTTQKYLNKKIKEIVSQSAFVDKIPSFMILNGISTYKWLIIEKNYHKPRIFLKKLWKAEKNVKNEIERLNNHNVLPYQDNIVEIVEEKCNIKYESLQKEVFKALKTTGIKIVTGGPGTGKTTTINGVIEAYQLLNPGKKVVLCAPTGRAAQKMKESTRHEALTIHKLLNYQPFGKNDVSHKDFKDPIEADFIIVDEFSMIDIELTSILLNAIKNNSIVLFVGDVDQLPSVGPGNVMHDLINSKTIEIYKLDAIFRQTDDSSIILNANKIKNGKTDLTIDKDFKIIITEDEESMISNLKSIIEEIDFVNMFETQVLASVKKGTIGTYNINRILQNIINDDEECLTYGNSVFRKKDKILLNRNNYEIGYYNGDIGIITKITKNGITVLINQNEFLIPPRFYDDLSLAYVMTIHKSQGSEFDNVIIVLPEYPKISLQRNLIFTAITRAKKNVTLIVQKNALNIAIKTNNTIHRKTQLCSRLLDLPFETILPKEKSKYINYF